MTIQLPYNVNVYIYFKENINIHQHTRKKKERLLISLFTMVSFMAFNIILFFTVLRNSKKVSFLECEISYFNSFLTFLKAK